MSNSKLDIFNPYYLESNIITPLIEKGNSRQELNNLDLKEVIDIWLTVRESILIESARQWLSYTLDKIDSKSKEKSSIADQDQEKTESAILLDRLRLEEEHFKIIENGKTIGVTIFEFKQKRGLK